MTSDETGQPERDGPLDDHARRGKRFVPPMREAFEEIGAGWLSWLDDLLPDLVWLQLLVNQYGEGRCVALTSDLVTRLGPRCAPCRSVTKTM